MYSALLDKTLSVSRYTHTETISLIFFSDCEDIEEDLCYFLFKKDHPDFEVVQSLERGSVIKLKKGSGTTTQVLGPQGAFLIRIERIRPA